MPADRIIPPPPPGWASKEDEEERGALFASQRGWERLMAEALAEAHKALESAEVPVGAVVVDAQGQIIGRGHNSPVTANDPSGHAEINAMREAAQSLGNYRLGGAYLVVTLEPCLMCAGAAVHSRLAGVVYGARDPKAGAVESCLAALDLPFHNHQPWHMGGIMEKECAALLSDFFAERRE
ncbi:tRNA adenosine(34) deaminase TadA [Desulfovibrio sp. OttesenSCG-928-C06]|nr:tRNA adenosine(34) deaminase TadA [Desulfovibrio sp. OttesenSCG-928-C06]